jgi:hypothetical protein
VQVGPWTKLPVVVPVPLVVLEPVEPALVEVVVELLVDDPVVPPPVVVPDDPEVLLEDEVVAEPVPDELVPVDPVGSREGFSPPQPIAPATAKPRHANHCHLY